MVWILTNGSSLHLKKGINFEFAFSLKGGKDFLVSDLRTHEHQYICTSASANSPAKSEPL